MESRALIEATCPECRGPLTELQEGNDVVEFRCLVGHRYSPLVLLHAHYEAQERALWAAVVALEEARNLAQAVGPLFGSEAAQALERIAEEKWQQAQDIRKVLEHLKPFQVP